MVVILDRILKPGTGHHPGWDRLSKGLNEATKKLATANYKELGQHASMGALVTCILGVIGGSAVGLVRSQNKVKDKIWSLPSISPEHRSEWWKHQISVPLD